MKVGIIQSNYIPWRGYFDFIDDVDLFIYYDDTQYTRRNWRNRNQIKTPSGLIWLTVPVVFSLSDKTNIEDARIDYRHRWIEKHINSIKCSYSKSPFYKQFSEEFFSILSQKFETISELNINVNNWIMKKLDIKAQIKKSSEFQAVGSKMKRPLEILKEVGATFYLSGPTAKAYTHTEEFKEAGIGLEYKVYEYEEYPQLYGRFEPYVSVMDLLFNCGPDSRKYLKSLKANEKVV